MRTTDTTTMFQHTFGCPPEGTWAAPGRINLIGEHTDYNDGFVLPLGLPQRVHATAARRSDNLLRLATLETDSPIEIAVDTLEPAALPGWATYPAGVIWALREAGHPIGGLNILIGGSVPLGAGLSSSAALECATALAVTDLYGRHVSRQELAHITQHAENAFVGMPCGIMDQSASLLATAGHVLFLDTRTLETEQIPLNLTDHNLTLLAVDTRAPHQLVDGEYATRRHTCEQAASLLGVKALRDITTQQLPDALDQLRDPAMRRRVRHVVTENARVLDTVKLLRADTPAEIGPLLTASHASMRNDYQITVPQTDIAVEAALSAGALGARMTGGGFGGCIIVLTAGHHTENCANAIRAAFDHHGFSAPTHFLAIPSHGAEKLS
jgi:galactokinase